MTDVSLAADVKNRGTRALSDREADAAQLLFDDGWSLGELAMTFQADEGTIRPYLDDEGVEVPR
jgi:hypothetical protein